MDAEPDCVLEVRRCDTSVEGDRDHDLVRDDTVDVAVSKSMKAPTKKNSLLSTFKDCLAEASKQKSIAKRRKKKEIRKVLIDMLLRSDQILENYKLILENSKLILAKTEQLQRQAEVLIENISEEMHASASKSP
jgi:hypothetical protein